MTDLNVEVASLAGFKLDLQDLGATLSSNTARLLPAVTLPTGAAGLIATLTPSFEKFRNAISSAQQGDLATVNTLSENLAIAATRYRTTDDASTNALSAASMNAFSDTGVAGRSDDGVKRFGGLQLPSLSEVQENQYTVREVVTTAIEHVSGYDEPLGAAIGLKPAADYLIPLVVDWEALQAIGKRIGLLGINDYVASENIIGGTRWLRSSWSGDASQAFETSASTLGQSVAERSTDLDMVSKIVENGGACLERLVYNQAMGLAGGLLQSMSFLGFSLPLGDWAQLVDRPIRESIKSEITSAVDSLKKSAESRRASMTTIIERICRAVDYVPGRTIPSFNASEFEISDKVVVDIGTIRYGFGDNVWWENSIASTP
ncbi:hypothetical protein [Nocardia sp. NPDC005366]|uniref:hypothetical protein n=1 Tax=Nocardia sp. NPDC005366 TaxID=3156878 RepID=UPI0033B8F049